MKRHWIFVFFVLFLISTKGYAENPTPATQPNAKSLEQKVSQLTSELENLKLDRNNILKQAQSFQKEKASLLAEIETLKGSSSGASAELDSLKKENEIINAEVEKLKLARSRDHELFEEEKKVLQKKLDDEVEKSNSLAQTIQEYSPEKIDTLIEDRNRLQGENKRLAERMMEYEKKLEEMKKYMTPLELDREELHKLQVENRELKERAGYIVRLENRQKQLIKENKEYREQLEVLKAKFKESVPGLAKASRISQKMMRENSQMHYNLGTIFLQNKKYKEAINEYEKVLELSPNDPDTHYNLGILYDDYLKDREKALYHYQKYLAVNPKSPDAKKVESYILAMELEQKVR